MMEIFDLKEEEFKNDDIKKRYEKLKLEMDIIYEFIENAYEGLVIVDGDGIITKFKYEKLMGIKEEDAIGRPVGDIIENTRIPEVIKSGRREVEKIQNINGKDVLTTRIPIKRGNKTIGAVGTVLFKDIKEIKYLANHIEKLQNKVSRYRGEIDRMNSAKYSFDNIVTKNRRMKHIKAICKKASHTNATILIEGDSGTGKEYFAHSIHKSSHRQLGPFVRINCAAIPNNLLESELFGYEDGAFTGASKGGRVGKFELANGGTIFLDEISSMQLEMQAKILRVLEERECERIGGNKKIDLDIRVIAASNESLEEMIKKGKFREDLYYRLNVINIRIPKLKERKEDISILADMMLENFSKEYDEIGKKRRISKEAYAALENYSWPGNVRELRNAIERAISISEGTVVRLSDLPKNVSGIKTPDGEDIEMEDVKPLKEQMHEAEIKIIEKTIRLCNGNKSKAAKLLDVHRTCLYKKIDRNKPV